MNSSSQQTNSTAEMVAACEEMLGYHFQNKRLIAEALTHSSFAEKRVNSYERLEFLGDSVLGLTVCEYLFHRFPAWLEGDLTKVKSNVVSRQTCTRMGLDLGIDRILVVGKGVGTLGRVPSSLIANGLESIVGAIFLDGGIESAREFLMPLIEKHVDAAVEGRLEVNYKSELQQYSQKRFNVPPSYRVVGDRGPDHEKEFLVAAHVHKQSFSPAWGSNKKEAEQRAAANALAEIEGNEPPFFDA